MRTTLAVIAAACAVGCGKGNGSAPGTGSATADPVGAGDAGSGAPDAVAGVTIDATPARVEHAVWTLAHNRLMAHRLIDGDLVVDAGTSGVARYHRFGLPTPRWKLATTIDGEVAAVSASLPALEVPLVEAQVGATRIVLRIHVPEPRTLAVKINGRKASDGPGVALVAGWQTIEVRVGPGRWQVGENLIALEAGRRTEVALAWLRITERGGTDDPRTAATFDSTTGAVSLASGAGLAWYVVIPDGANLVGDVAGDPACRIEVGARTSDGTFAGGLLAGAGARVDLASLAGRAVRLELAVRDCTRATLTGARITLHGPEPEVPPPGPPPRYVVFWVMDALRADRIRAFTPGARAETPAFDDLATGGVVFRQYYVQGNESQTSHSSLWTALYPAVHGVRLAGQGGRARLDRRFAGIGDLVKAAGLKTTGVTGNGYVNEYGGYTRGFDEFRNLMQEKGVMNVVLQGKKIVDVAIARLDALRADPTFQFIGTIDNHNPLWARKPWIDRYDPGPYNGPFQTHGTAKELGLIRGQMGCHVVPPPRDIERMRAIYDSCVSYADDQLGRFVAQLKTWGIYDQTMIVVTADHGEEQFEESRCGHGASLRETLVHVPLLVHYPARFPGGTIVEEGAEGVDVLPTILDALDAEPLDPAQGASLRPLAHGVGKGWVRPSYASQYEYAHTMRLGRYKARVGKTGIPVITDLGDDPLERKDLARLRPVERRMMTDHLGLFLSLRLRWKKSTWGVVSNMTANAAAEIDAPPAPPPDPLPVPP